MTAMTTSHTAVITLPTDTQILITREFAAPKNLVYRAYTEPELIKRWWGGDRGEVKSAEVDLRVGGSWRYVMAAHGDFEVAFHGDYKEVVPNDRLVYSEVYEGAPDPDAAAAHVIAEFAEKDGRTTLTLLSQLPNREVRDIIIESGMEVGMQEGFDKMEQLAVDLL